MANNIFDIGVGGLNAAQYGLTTTSHNISNANTQGYSRQSAQVESAGGQCRLRSCMARPLQRWDATAAADSLKHGAVRHPSNLSNLFCL